MKEIDAIEPSEDTLMTDNLIRIFKSAGCSPTECHACGAEIKAGDIFKLVPHPVINGNGNYLKDLVTDLEKELGGFDESRLISDEMCCAKCSSHELKLRDRRYKKRSEASRAAKKAAGGHGYSRPHKLKIETP